MNAGEGEIGCNRLPSGHLRDDVVNVEGGGLSDLRESAVFAAVTRAVPDHAPQAAGNGHGSALGSGIDRLDLCSELENGQRGGDLSDGLRFAFLGGGEAASATLLVQQMLQPVVESLRQAKLCEVSRHVNSELDGAAHGAAVWHGPAALATDL